MEKKQPKPIVIKVLMCKDCKIMQNINFDGIGCPKCGGHLVEVFMGR